MAIDLATTQQIIDRLNLPPGVFGPEQNAVVDAWRLALQDRVLRLTGFLVNNDPYFNPVRITAEEQQDVQIGVSRLMRYRPIIPINPADPQNFVILQARSLASATFNTILGDLKDRQEGRVMPLASELTPIFPPIGGLASWYRWRQMIWPFVQFTYLVDPLGSPTNSEPLNSLNRAVVEWAAFIWAMQPYRGRLAGFSAEQISENYIHYTLKGPYPPIVAALLARYIRGAASIIF